MDRNRQILLIKANSQAAAFTGVSSFTDKEFPGIFKMKHIETHKLPGEVWIEHLAHLNEEELRAGVDNFIREVHESQSADDKEIKILEACADAIHNNELNGLIRFYNITDKNFMYPEDDNGWWAIEVEVETV